MYIDVYGVCKSVAEFKIDYGMKFMAYIKFYDGTELHFEEGSNDLVEVYAKGFKGTKSLYVTGSLIDGNMFERGSVIRYLVSFEPIAKKMGYYPDEESY